MSKKVFITTGLVALIGGVATAVSVSSCDDVCTMESKPSVVVKFYDELGNPYVNDVVGSVAWWHITDPVVAGSAPDPAVEPPVAEGYTNAQCLDDECSAWIAGWETEGTIEVRATVCGHEYIERIDVPMQGDMCHVDTQELSIAVDTSDCDGDVVDSGPPTHPTDPDGCDSFQKRPSIIVQVATTIDGGFVPLPADAVHGTLWNEEGTAKQEVISGMCMDPICSKFAVGIEQTGEFDVQVDVCGTSHTEKISVGMQEDGCHVDTVQKTIVIDPDSCATHEEPPTLVAQPVPKLCDLMAHPSAIVWTLQQFDDYQASIDVDALWYTHEDQRHKARCFDANAEGTGCSIWVAGLEQAGPMTLATEYCGKEQSKEIRVDMTEDGCHVETEYVSMLLSSTGCLTGEPEPRRPPEPPAGTEH